MTRKIDRRKRKRSAKVLKAKSKTLAKAVKTPAQIAREFEKVKLANLVLEDRVADLERRTTNLEIVVSDLYRRVARIVKGLKELARRLLRLLVDPRPGPPPPPVLGDACWRISEGP
jgi:uncharacterized coiled-coil protein SlyX